MGILGDHGDEKATSSCVWIVGASPASFVCRAYCWSYPGAEGDAGQKRTSSHYPARRLEVFDIQV
jgi:hypothetical protein